MDLPYDDNLPNSLRDGGATQVFAPTSPEADFWDDDPATWSLARPDTQSRRLPPNARRSGTGELTRPAVSNGRSGEDTRYGEDTPTDEFGRLRERAGSRLPPPREWVQRAADEERQDEPSERGRRGRGRSRKRSGPLSTAFGAVAEVAVVVALALTLALVIKTFLVQAFFIPSQSMENTLLTGDRVLVSKLTPNVFGLKHGDIVVFKDPGGWLPKQPPVDQGPLGNGVRTALTFVGLLPQDSGEHLIKRVIGLPGDKVMCCDAQGRVQVNGTPITETYVYPGNAPSDLRFSVTVPAGKLWVMGDHRAVSEDSRYHPQLDNGMVPVSDVVGKAFVLVWPLNRMGMLSTQGDVFAGVPDPPASP